MQKSKYIIYHRIRKYCISTHPLSKISVSDDYNLIMVIYRYMPDRQTAYYMVGYIQHNVFVVLLFR